MNILTADIGGTHSRLAVYVTTTAGLSVCANHHYDNDRFADFGAVLRDFLQRFPDTPIDSACLAVAGPVAAGVCHLTNRDWVLDATALAAAFPLGPVHLINDLVAVAYGIDDLPAAALHTVQAAVAVPHGLRTVVGVGTGLGLSVAVATATGLQVLASEAGHADYAPASDWQWRLVGWLREAGPVAVESLLSGSGLVNIYRALQALHGDHPAAVTAASVAAAARAGEASALEAVEGFFEMLGSYLGNVALQTLPYGGLYLAGGVVPRLLDLLPLGRMLLAYRNKARMQSILDAIPIAVITDESVARLGAARYALLHGVASV